jgi:hypothetical protein
MTTLRLGPQPATIQNPYECVAHPSVALLNWKVAPRRYGEAMTQGLPTWAGSVDAEALAQLLGLGGERDWLDFKSQCNLSEKRDQVAITKDIAAMMITGGYLVIGAGDHGQPAGEPAHLDLFDPATLHAKVARYVTGQFELRVGIHSHQGQTFVLIYVAPHPDGLCVFERDGSYPDPVTGKSRLVFQAGQVFARHGTSSEPWKQSDIAIIKRRLAADADRGRDQAAEALALLTNLPGRIADSGLWLAVAVSPQYQPVNPTRISPDAAQAFLTDWAFASAPIDHFGGGTPTYRQPGGVVITAQAFWHLAIADTGAAVGARCLAYEVAASPVSQDRRWRWLPANIGDGLTIPIRRDELEYQLEILVNVLTAHALKAGAGGRAVITAALVAPQPSPQQRVVLLNESVDDGGEPAGWHAAGPRAIQALVDVAERPMTTCVPLADMQDARARLAATYHLAGELLALFAIDEPTLLKADGTLDPYGAAVSHQQVVYQHAQHLGLPVPEASPAERRQEYEATVRAAKDKLRQR